MRVLLRLVTLALALALLNAVSLAQPPFGGPPGGGDSMMLLRQESVQKELKLVPDQIDKAQELSERMRERMRDVFEASEEDRPKKMQELRTETDKAIAGILKPEQ